MSKTTTTTRNLRITTEFDVTDHVINAGKSERHLKDNNMFAKGKRGHVLGTGSEKGEKKERRISIRNSNSSNAIETDTRPQPAEIKRSRSKSDLRIIGTGAEKQNIPSSTITSATVENRTPSEPNSKKVPIDKYFAARGVDYRRLRKDCKMRVIPDKPGASTMANLHIDFFQPPDGYSLDDLPDSQGVSSQNCEDQAVSPAVMIAAQKRKDRMKLFSVTTPETDNDEIIRRLRMGRPAASLPETANTPGRMDDAFPDTSLNDSDLIMASQQVECEFAVSAKDVIKRDINGNSKKQTPPSAPLTSTPIPDLVKNSALVAKETPKTTRGLSRSRNRSNGHHTNQSSIFENSNLGNDTQYGHCNLSVEGDADTPRKLLKFDESPIKKVVIESNMNLRSDNSNEDFMTLGDFEDDNEDEIFSQIALPGEMREPRPAVFESSVESDASLASTQVAPMSELSSGKEEDMNCTEMDSFLLDDVDMAALDKLEAIHCESGGSSVNSVPINTPIEVRPSKPVPRVVPTDKCLVTNETPRTRARRQGLSRNRSRVVAH